MQLQELLENISQKTGKKKEDLNKELNSTYDRFKNGNEQQLEKFRKSDAEIKQLAMANFKASYRKELTTKGTIFDCIIFSASAINRERGIGDMVSKRRNAAFEYYQQDAESALEKGIVKIAENDVKDENNFIVRKGEVIPLHYDTQEKFDDMAGWLINANYEVSENGSLIKNGQTYIGKPLPKTSFQRTLIGIAKKSGEPNSEYKQINIRLRDRNVDVFVPTCVPIVCSLYVKKTSTDSSYVCNDSGAFIPKIAGDELSEKQVMDYLTKFYGEDKLELKDFDEKVGARPNDWNYWVWVKAMITDIVPSVDGKSQQISIEDDTMEMFDKAGNPISPLTCWVSDHIKLNAPERSEVFIIGRPQIKEAKENIYKSITVLGMFVPQIFRNTVNNKDIF